MFSSALILGLRTEFPLTLSTFRSRGARSGSRPAARVLLVPSHSFPQKYMFFNVFVRPGLSRAVFRSGTIKKNICFRPGLSRAVFRNGTNKQKENSSFFARDRPRSSTEVWFCDPKTPHMYTQIYLKRSLNMYLNINTYIFFYFICLQIFKYMQIYRLSATAHRPYGVPEVSPSGATLSLTHLHIFTSIHCTLYTPEGPESGRRLRGHPPHAAS